MILKEIIKSKILKVCVIATLTLCVTPIVSASTDASVKIKSDPTVVNGGVDLETRLEGQLDKQVSKTSVQSARASQVILSI